MFYNFKAIHFLDYTLLMIVYNNKNHKKGTVMILPFLYLNEKQIND